MAMARRADINDRGRRWIPKNGKFGSITISNNQSTIRMYMTIEDESGNNVWPVVYTAVDAYSGNVTTFCGTSSTPNPLHTWDTANGGTVTCKLPGILVGSGMRGQKITSVVMKGADKWSDLSSVDWDTNCISQFTTSEWPNLTYIDMHSNDPLTEFKTYEWPLLEELLLYGCSVQVIDTFEWPNLTNFNVAGCEAPEIETYEWPNLEIFVVKDNFMTSINLNHEWPNLTQLDLSYSYVEGTVNTNNGWASINDITCFYARGNPITFFETHPEWTTLKSLSIGFQAPTRLDTYNTWTLLETLIIDKTYTLTDIEIHPEWTNFKYLNSKNNPFADATVIDEIYINVDACGSVNGTIDVRSSAYAADINRSASANTALSNLTTKGWAVLR